MNNKYIYSTSYVSCYKTMLQQNCLMIRPGGICLKAKYAYAYQNFPKFLFLQSRRKAKVKSCNFSTRYMMFF